MNETKNFLPLGSVVILENAVKKLLLIARGNVLNGTYYDYGAILYPEGMIDDSIAYFNEEEIAKVVYEGYVDDDNELMVETINHAYAQFSSQPSPFEETKEIVEEEDDPFASVRDMEDWQ